MDWADRFAGVRRWSRGGERAAHKPLLLLYALGQFQRQADEPILFSQAEENLARLLAEFGPPRRTTPAYPFHYLTSDGLWTVSTADGGASPGPSPSALRRQEAAGRFTPELARSLRADPGLLPRLARVVLDTNFEPSLHADICAAIGLDLEAAETQAAGEAERRRRDPEFPRLVLMAYEYKCAFCEFDGALDNGSAPGLEAAHVRWWTHGGPNDIDNGLCLCSIHHKLFDKGVLGVTGEQVITVSQHFTARSHAAQHLVYDLSGKRVIRPMRGYPAVAANHAAWHAREVFRAPARTA